MFPRYSFGEPCDRTLAKNANRLKLDICSDGNGNCDISWELHGMVNPNSEPDDDGWFPVTQDVNFVEKLVSMFTQRPKGEMQ